MPSQVPKATNRCQYQSRARLARNGANGTTQLDRCTRSGPTSLPERGNPVRHTRVTVPADLGTYHASPKAVSRSAPGTGPVSPSCGRSRRARSTSSSSNLWSGSRNHSPKSCSKRRSR